MKKLELKKLGNEFSEFLAKSGRTKIESVLKEFWFAKYGVNNEEREEELLNYWENH